MSKQDSVTVSIEKSLYTDISKDAEQVGNNVKHNVETILQRYLEKNKLSEKLWEGLRIYESQKDHVLLASLKDRKFFDVERFKDNRFKCKQDDSESCEHVNFVWFKYEDLLNQAQT